METRSKTRHPRTAPRSKWEVRPVDLPKNAISSRSSYKKYHPEASDAKTGSMGTKRTQENSGRPAVSTVDGSKRPKNPSTCSGIINTLPLGRPRRKNRQLYEHQCSRMATND